MMVDSNKSQYDTLLNSLSDDELDLLNSDPQLFSDFRARYGVGQEKNGTGWLGKTWDALKVPEQKSREGLKMLAGMVPQTEPGQPYKSAGYEDPQSQEYHKMHPPSVANDLMLNSPRIIADTVAEVAPSFVNRGAIVASGILGGAKMALNIPGVKPALKAGGKWLGEQMGRSSGLADVPVKTPPLEAQFKDPTTMFAAGKTEGQKAYETAKNAENAIRPEFQDIETSIDRVRETLKSIDSGGVTTQEALAARQALRDTENHWDPIFFRRALAKIDRIAKQDFADADAGYVRAITGEALRKLGPINKNGTQSKLLTYLTLKNPLLAPLYSPATQSVMATGAGIATRRAGELINNPLTGAAISGIADSIDLVRKNKDKRGVVDYNWERGHGKRKR